MDANGSGRRRFLKHAASLAGVAAGVGAGAEWAARGQSAKPEGQAKSGPEPHDHRELLRRGARFSVDHITYYTPLQDYGGIITPTHLHFVQQHSSHFPEIDAQQHRLTIHGLVDRPLSLSMDDLKHLPSVSRVHFLECQGNSSGVIHHQGNQNMGLPVQYIWGMTSCSEWTGVPLSVLLNEVGLQKEASWLVYEGADPGRFSHTLPLAKALDDVFVAYGQNGEPLRVEQGYPIRMIVPAGGLGGLLSTEYDYNRTKPVNIYGPPGTDASIKALVQFLTVSADIRISEGMRTVPSAKVFFGHDTGVGVIYQDVNVKVTAAENSHFNFQHGSLAYGKYKSYSYRFETADRVIVFSGDTGPSAALDELAKGADLLVTEVISVEEWKEQQIKTGRWQLMTPEQQARALRRQVEEHITPDEIGKMATRGNVKTVVLSHFLPATDPNDEYERLGEQVSEHFSGRVLVAKDLMEF
jgi:DMSO/TMAO reductase YedYZ molybdopterin-dependent catalytic subunit/ribonuclease BN (tRNA processing enzyme)